MKKIALAFVLATGLSTNAFAYRSGDSVCASYSGGHNWCGVVVSDTGGKNIQVAIQRVKIKSNMLDIQQIFMGIVPVGSICMTGVQIPQFGYLARALIK